MILVAKEVWGSLMGHGVMVLLEGWRHVMERGNGSRHVSVMVGVRVVVVAKVGGIGNKK